MTLKEDLARELNNNNSGINDVTLVGSDGGLVVASKAILSIRSPVFRKCLFGLWVNNQSFPMCFTSKVLRAVVEYCYTDTSWLWMASWNEEVSDELAATLVQLQVAARLFQIPELYQSTRASLEIRLASHPGCVCAIMKELMEWGWMRNSGQEGLPAEKVIDEKFWSDCMKRIEEKPFESLLPTTGNAGMRGRPLAFLELVFRTLWGKLKPLAAVKVLREWRSGVLLFRDEFEKLKGLANTIELRFIPYADLWELDPCDLFSSSRLKIAMEYHHSELYAPEGYFHVIPQSPGGDQHSNSDQSSDEEQKNGKGETAPSRASQRLNLRHKQQRALLLYHSAQCQVTSNCTVTRHCATFKKLWRHMEGCKKKECEYPHCASSQRMLVHFSKCKNRATCPVCGPCQAAFGKDPKLEQKLEQNSQAAPTAAAAAAAADVVAPATTTSSDSSETSTREQKRQKVG